MIGTRAHIAILAMAALLSNAFSGRAEEANRVEPKNAELTALEAWTMATSPDPKARNGKKAVELAQKLCEATDWKKPHFVGILAAAYAEEGDFGAAVKYQQKALEDPEYAENWGRDALKWLSLYQEKKPLRIK